MFHAPALLPSSSIGVRPGTPSCCTSIGQQSGRAYCDLITPTVMGGINEKHDKGDTRRNRVPVYERTRRCQVRRSVPPYVSVGANCDIHGESNLPLDFSLTPMIICLGGCDLGRLPSCGMPLFLSVLDSRPPAVFPSYSCPLSCWC